MPTRTANAPNKTNGSNTMKRTLILTSALCGLAFAAQAQNKEVNVV